MDRFISGCDNPAFKSKPISIIVSGISYVLLCVLLSTGAVKAQLHPSAIRLVLGKPAGVSFPALPVSPG